MLQFIIVIIIIIILLYSCEHIILVDTEVLTILQFFFSMT